LFVFISFVLVFNSSNNSFVEGAVFANPVSISPGSSVSATFPGNAVGEYEGPAIGVAILPTAPLTVDTFTLSCFCALATTITCSVSSFDSTGNPLTLISTSSPVACPTTYSSLSVEFTGATFTTQILASASDFGVFCFPASGSLFAYVYNAGTSAEQGAIASVSYPQFIDDTTYFITYAITTTTVTSGSGTGDPHFSGFAGENFDFTGVAGKVFALFSSNDLVINALFAKPIHPEAFGSSATFMSEIGIMQGDTSFIKVTRFDDVQVSPFVRSDSKSFDTFLLPNNGTLQWVSPGTAHINFPPKISITVSRVAEMVTVGEYDVYMQVGISVSPEHYGQENIHGIIGQTIIPLDQRNVGPVDVLQGGGQIEGVWKDYIISDDNLFGTLFAYSCYNKTSTKQITTTQSQTVSAVVSDIKPKLL